jgi:5'-nucleotidase
MKRWRSVWPIIILVCFLFNGCPSGYAKEPLQVKILAFNDFHGHLTKECSQSEGGAPVLAAYFEEAAQGFEGRTFLVHAGDLVGGSPAVSALLRDEPSILFLNILAAQKCPDFRIIGTLGNHEFDRGKEELLRLIYGGDHRDGGLWDKPYPGADFPYVCANVVDSKTSRFLLPPYLIEEVQGIPLAFIGAVTTETPNKCSKNLSDLRFLDEAETINFQVDVLKRLGVRAIIVLIHEGGAQKAYYTKTDPNDLEKNKVTGKIKDIVSRLDPEVDVVISGHTHKFTNTLIKNILVTQAYCHGEAYADIDVEINLDTKNIVAKSAVIKRTFNNRGPGKTPQPKVLELVKETEGKAEEIEPDFKKVINRAQKDIYKKPNAFGESLLGDLVADSHRAAGKTRFAFVNLGSIRAKKICQGNVTWSDLFSVQPFRNELVRLQLTGKNIYEVLEQQWAKPQSPKFLQVSGLHYTWKDAPSKPRIVNVWDNTTGKAINKASLYEVTVNSFLAGGGDNFTEFTRGKKIGAVYDLDALVDYAGKLRQPFASQGRISKIKASSPPATAALPETVNFPGAPQGRPVEPAQFTRGRGRKFKTAEVDIPQNFPMIFKTRHTGPKGRSLSPEATTDAPGTLATQKAASGGYLGEWFVPFFLLLPGLFGLLCAVLKDKRFHKKQRGFEGSAAVTEGQQENQFLMALCNGTVWVITLLVLALLGFQKLHFFSQDLTFEFYVPILGFLGALLYMFHMFHKGEQKIPKGKEFGMRILLAPYVAIIVVVLFGRDLGLVDLKSTAGRGTLAFFSGLLVIAFLQQIIEKGQERLGRWRESSRYEASEIAQKFNLSLEEDLKLRKGDLRYLVQLEQYTEEQLREKARQIGFDEHLLVGLKHKCPEARLKEQIGSLVWGKLKKIGVSEIEDLAQLSDSALEELNEGEAKPKIDLAILKNLRDRAREICLPPSQRLPEESGS